jgi:hypothetical protein
MKKWIAVLLAVAIALAVWFYFSKNRNAPPAASPETIAAENSAVANALAKQNPAIVAIINSNFARVQTPQENLDSTAAGKILPAPAGQPAPLQFTNFAPATVLQNVSRAVRQYGEMFGGNPVGNNAEITAALNGQNPKGINFIKPEGGMRINENGELVDAWGTPFFFHQLSGTDMEIHSAGPDKAMWTSDDLVGK